MKLQIVSFDVAKDLQELGFNWRTRQTYTQLTDWLSENDSELNRHMLKAPEQALVVKWFRDVHNLKITVYPKRFFEDLYCLSISNKKKIIYEEKHFHRTYEEAELEGIKECIKYLKNERNS